MTIEEYKQTIINRLTEARDYLVNQQSESEYEKGFLHGGIEVIERIVENIIREDEA